MANFKAITTTTYGYKDLTLNLLKSIEKNNIDLDIEVFVPDNKSEIFFKEHTKNINKSVLIRINTIFFIWNH